MTAPKRGARKVEPKRKLGRPPSFTPEMQTVACNAAEKGLSRETSAAVAGVSYRTLKRHFDEDPVFRQALEKAEAAGRQEMCDLLWKAARDGNVTAMIFWLKTRTQEFREVREIELRGPDETADQIRKALELTRNTVPRAPKREENK